MLSLSNFTESRTEPQVSKLWSELRENSQNLEEETTGGVNTQKGKKGTTRSEHSVNEIFLGK